MDLNLYNKTAQTYDRQKEKEKEKKQAEAIIRQAKSLTSATAHNKGNIRNQPCECGSGKKFKKCCWGKVID